MGSYALVFIIPFYKQDWYIAIDVVKPFGNFYLILGYFMTFSLPYSVCLKGKLIQVKM